MLLIRHGGGRKILPNSAVFATGQEQNIRIDGTAAGTTNLLVVAHRRRRRAQVHDKTQIGLIKTHTEGTRCNKSLHPVFLERLLRNQPLIRVSFTGVCEHLVAAGTQGVCGIFCRRDSQRVDNARTGQAVQVREQPADALRFIRQGQNAQAQGLAGQRTAQHMHGCAGIGTELFGNIAANTVIRGCGSRQHRHARRQRFDERTNTAVVGAEVMAPVRNTVRLINNEQTQARQQVR